MRLDLLGFEEVKVPGRFPCGVLGVFGMLIVPVVQFRVVLEGTEYFGGGILF